MLEGHQTVSPLLRPLFLVILIYLGCLTQICLQGSWHGWEVPAPPHDPCSAPFQLRRMQEMLQKIQKQMKDSH